MNTMFSRRKVLGGMAVLGMVPFAGCLDEIGSLHISTIGSEESDHDSFEDITITFDEGRARPVDPGEADESPDPVEMEDFDLTIALSDLQGEEPSHVGSVEVEAQEYQSVEFHVETAEGSIDGTDVSLTPPEDGWLVFEDDFLVLEDDEYDCVLGIEIVESALSEDFELESGSADIELRE